jgi:hypothetical protein
MLLWISAGILDIRRHLESDKKLFFCELWLTKIQAQIMKQNAKKFKAHWVMGGKLNFSTILKITAILKTCEKNFPIFWNFQSLIFMQNMAKKKYLKIPTLFEIMSFLWSDFSAQFFGKMALKKIQDGIRFEISLQKSIDRKILLQKSLFLQCCRLQARLKKLKCKNFPI